MTPASDSTAAPPNYEVVIQPNRNWVHIDWRALVEFRDLLYLLVRRDFVAKHRQTILGPAWFVVAPVLTTLMMTVVFGNIANIPTDGQPAMLFYFCGLLTWNYFSQNVNHTGTVFTTYSDLFGKVYFPRLIIPLSLMISNLAAFAIQLITFLGFWIYFKFFTVLGPHFWMTWGVVLIPLLLAQTALLSLGVGLWMSAATAKYRDLVHVLALILQLWMYATPIIWPLSLIAQKHPRFAWLFVLNPLSVIVETYRFAFFGKAMLGPVYFLVSVGMTVAIFLSGLMLFQRTERTFIDTV